MHLAVVQVDGRYAVHLAVLDQERAHEPFIVAQDGLILERGLEQGMKHMETGLVGGKKGAIDAHATKGPHTDAAIRVAAPGAAPCSSWISSAGLRAERLHDVLVRQEIAAEMVSLACRSRLSYSRRTAAVPPRPTPCRFAWGILSR